MGIASSEAMPLHVSGRSNLAYHVEGVFSNTNLLQKEFIENCEGEIEDEVKYQC